MFKFLYIIIYYVYSFFCRLFYRPGLLHFLFYLMDNFPSYKESPGGSPRFPEMECGITEQNRTGRQDSGFSLCGLG